MAQKRGKTEVSSPKKRGPKLASEGDRKVVVSAGVPAKLVESFDRWRTAAGLNRSQAVTEAIRKLVE